MKLVYKKQKVILSHAPAKKHNKPLGILMLMLHRFAQVFKKKKKILFKELVLPSPDSSLESTPSTSPLNKYSTKQLSHIEPP